MTGRFITFEGGEGCGKSTQLSLLTTGLRKRGFRTLSTREPGGTDAGEVIRHLLKHAPEGRGMCAETELLLFAASRAQLVREKIAPALAAGTWVLADRFLDSTTVYQGIARALDARDVAAINRFAVGACLPDLTLLFDLPADVGLARARGRADAVWDRMEAEAVSFYESVRRGYLELARRESHRFLVLDASRPPEELATLIWDELDRRFTLPS